MATNLRVHVETSELNANQMAARTRLIYDIMLRESPHFDGGNFATIHSSDLKRLFHQYDTSFFKAKIGATLGRTPLHFRLSKRTTILVQDARGRRHSDGNRYSTFHIPVESLEALRRVNQTGSDAR